ncbi:MraZ protein [Geothermobacter ehrlichii]|uniref:Transcriptional regulator MraZ n=1 Tax=Geothermobacter ehrlichii TaxID=213224 RepID=A0A5D3WF42_9BACT|nr:division/cell wall cluster transcriptional repressor MraZ [Geothermobacter ehrlichii]TYO96085.1 MraZ protein [Geothermobacter ehrlichii]
MVNFTGKYFNSIDAKGRAIIPARFREELARAYDDDRLVVTEGDGGLDCYPVPQWKEIVARIDALEPGQFKDDLYMTTVSPAIECSFDRQGRIQLTPALREHAGLVGETREFVAIGVSNKIRIMTRQQHADQRAQAQERLRQNPQARYNLGL